MRKRAEETAVGEGVGKSMEVDFKVKAVPVIFAAVGAAVMLAQWIAGLTLVTLIGAVYMCVTAAAITAGMIWKRRLYAWMITGYVCVSFGILAFYVIAGADAGWGAFVSSDAGFVSAEHALWQGEGNFFTRLAGNILLLSPAFLLVTGTCFFVSRYNGRAAVKNGVSYTLGVLLTVASIIFVFTMNLRARPRVFDMSEGHDEYLGKIGNNAKESNSPNVLFILMDDMGYGDPSYNAQKAGITPSFYTPNIDSIAQEGVDFDNFYANYSVCSPSRFATMTGRYPYRGYADNVMYPTVNTIVPFSATRVFNPIEMGANCDGMLGDEVTMAEMLSAAGYATGCFGKWHLGDYGEYLPTNQGFDYFYGSHHINDNTPYYHVSEGGSLGAGNYEIVEGTDINQDDNTKLIHARIDSWIRDQVSGGEKFFAYYATPWPHAPVHAGEEFRGKSGAGTYGDCLMEFDYYLGQLFNTLEELGVMDDTLIIFSSDNGPALQGSANELRGGKYTAYEAGQKIPFFMRWDNAPSDEYPLLSRQRNSQGEPVDGNTVYAPATLADLFPTLAYICNVTDGNKRGYLPSDVDREVDGVSMIPLLQDVSLDREEGYGKVFIHDRENPILHMKREKIKAVQYSVTREQLAKEVGNYDSAGYTGTGEDYMKLPLLTDYEFTTWKYFSAMQNDNPAFFNLSRKNWLICLTDDSSESYQRAQAFPDRAEDLANLMQEKADAFKSNRRGVYAAYYSEK